MNRRGLRWLIAVTTMALLVVATPVFPQQDATPVETAQPNEPDDSTVENILREQEDSLSGQFFSYEPGGRRDPFRSLFETLNAKGSGHRPPGIQGMMVTEIDLAGIIQDPAKGDMGLLMGSDNKGYFLRVGDSVYDGTIIGIDPRLGTMTFRQQIDDPRRIKPYRDVVKRLVPMDDEERADE